MIRVKDACRAQICAQLIQSMPKAELHVHLEGTIQPATLLALAKRNGLLDELPSHDIDGLKGWFSFRTFSDFIKVILTIHNMIRSRDDLALVVYECGRAMHAQNIRYRELTFTPYSHCHILKKGLHIKDLLKGLDAGRRMAAADFGVEMRWIFDHPRNASFPNWDGRDYDPLPMELSLRYALEGREVGVVGLGLGGDEVNAPPELYAHGFRIAKREGLLSVPHAGENQGPQSIWGAILELEADRIGHGVRAIDDPRLMQYLSQHQIPLEVNLSSNICLGIYPSLKEHPFVELDKKSIVLTMNTDDPPIFHTDLNQEYVILAREYGFGWRDIVRIARNAYVFSGAEPTLKHELLKEFDAWVETNAAAFQ